MSSNEDPAATRDQEVMENEVVEVGEGSNGDPAATRDQEVKETEEVDVGEGPGRDFHYRQVLGLVALVSSVQNGFGSERVN